MFIEIVVKINIKSFRFCFCCRKAKRSQTKQKTKPNRTEQHNEVGRMLKRLPEHTKHLQIYKIKDLLR